VVSHGGPPTAHPGWPLSALRGTHWYGLRRYRVIPLLALALGVWLGVLSVRLATLHRARRTVFAGPGVLWALPVTVILAVTLLAGGVWTGYRLAIRQARLEAVEPVLGRVSERLDSLSWQRGLTDSAAARPRGCPLSTGC